MDRAADALAERLYEAGCRHAFGMPGGEVLTLLDAFARAGIEFVIARHENAGGYMAEGTWQRTGAPAVLLATVGPGVTNALNVAVNAAQDRVPLIVISGSIDPADQVTYNHQVLDHQQVFRPVCKGSFLLTAEAAAALADKAVNLALQERPGPVHIDVPISVADAPAKSAGAPRRATIERAGPAPGEGLERARHWLAEAERPLIIAGYDAVLDGSAGEVREFAARSNIPVLTTYKAKGVVAEDDPIAIGSFALSPAADAIVKPLIEAADLLLLAGYDPIEVRSGWREPWDPARRRVVEFATRPNEHYVYQSSLSFVGHVGAGFAALGAAGGDYWPDGLPGTVRERLRGALGRNEAWGPGAVFDEVRKRIPRDAVATLDTGAHRIVGAQVWECYEPRTLLQSVGLGSMGCALPLGIGVKLAEPARAVLAMTGDGGLLMTLGELATLCDYEVALVVIVFVDRSLALIELKQRARGLANAGVDFPGKYDYVRLAEAFGGNGYRVADRAALRDALGEALDARRFSLIACEIDRGAYDDGGL